jgi:hypothetical protein
MTVIMNCKGGLDTMPDPPIGSAVGGTSIASETSIGGATLAAGGTSIPGGTLDLDHRREYSNEILDNLYLVVYKEFIMNCDYGSTGLDVVPVAPSPLWLPSFSNGIISIMDMAKRFKQYRDCVKEFFMELKSEWKNGNGNFGAVVSILTLQRKKRKNHDSLVVILVVSHVLLSDF